jgi:hypothetical protein
VWAPSGPATRRDPTVLLRSRSGWSAQLCFFFCVDSCGDGLELYDAVNAFLHLFRSKFEFTLLLATEKKRTSE